MVKVMKDIAIIGFGNQAKAWALNLRDSGWKVSVGLRPTSISITKAQELGFETFDYTQSNSQQNFAVLTPDDTHYDVVAAIGTYNLKATFIYAHGFGLLYTEIRKQFSQANHILLAPKAIASELRFQYETKGKNGGVYSFEALVDESKKEWALTLGKDLGLNSLHVATIEDETKADLFSEQSLLCSVLPYAALYSFKQLRESGISKEVAYFECWYEVKLIVDTLIKIGPEKFFNLISPNALVGSEIGRSAIFTDQYFIALHNIYNHIQSGEFEKQLETINIEQVRKDVLDFWNKEELTHLHNEMSKELFS
jgi:ketol-acid reductoisomerase